MILMIDNYDSFSYNLYQLIGQYNEAIRVIRNDELTVEEIKKLAPSHIVISPGPGKCEDAGIIVDLIRAVGRKIPILGICLGHQAICKAFGGKIVHAKQVMHGKSSFITIDPTSRLFSHLPQKMKVARYHSLACDASCIPQDLKVTAQADDGEIMAIEHRTYPIYGLQFHPESIMTPDGDQLIKNFLEA